MDEKDNFELDMMYYIRGRVERFGNKICKTLDKNVKEKGKGKWDGIPKELLIQKLIEEFEELLDALENGTAKDITLESTDVSAVCMMIHDNFGE